MESIPSKPNLQGNPRTSDDFEKFLRDNIGIIDSILRPYRGLDEYEDLVQVACLGIFKAIQTYSPNQNIKLTSYAYTCAKNEVKMYIRRNKPKKETLKHFLELLPEEGLELDSEALKKEQLK